VQAIFHAFPTPDILSLTRFTSDITQPHSWHTEPHAFYFRYL